MSMIQVKNLTFAYEGSAENVFTDVSFTLDTDWKLGFTGRNGRGKTTFLKLLMGQYDYQGKIISSETFDYFPYEIADEDDLTLDVLRQLAPDRQDWELYKELAKLDVGDDILYAPFYLLSKGQQTKVLIAAMFLKDNRFLLIDEPTNHLDMEGRDLLAAYLNKKQGFILVSHDRAFLDGCIDHVLAINRQNIEVQQGNFSAWLQGKAQRDARETAENEKLSKDIKRLQKSARQKADWSQKTEKSKKGTTNSGSKVDKGYVGHKSAKMMKRASVIESRRQSALRDKASLMKNIESVEDLEVHPLLFRQEVLVRADKLSVCYGDEPLFAPLTFTLTRGRVTALQGRNGSGKSSILQLICGESIPHTGRIEIASGVKISYVPQSADGLQGSLAAFAERKGVDYTKLLMLLMKLGFSRDLFARDIGTYSAGMKKKVLLAGSLAEEAHLYIWDEPLNYIDVISRMQIENLLKSEAFTMIFVEHDKRFTENTAMDEIKLV